MNEIEQTAHFLAESTFPGLKGVLSSHLASLKKAAAAAERWSQDPPSLPEKETTIPPAASIASMPATIGAKFINLEDISWTQDDGMVTLYLGLPGVGSAKDRVSVKFGAYSIDATAMDVDGKNYRYVQDNLDKDIIPADSKFIVKSNKIILKLRKKKGDYSYETWQQLVCKKKRDPNAEKKSKENPQDSIMDMMKGLYDEGDDNMKKVIGEAMMKSRSGQKPDEPPMPDF